MRVLLLASVLFSGAALAAACGGSSQGSDDSSDDDSSRGGSSGANTGGTSGTGNPPLDCGFGACQIGNDCYVNGVPPQPKGDGCNTCTCVEDTPECSNVPCNTNGDSCTSQGTSYPSGSLVPVDCNSCLCIDGDLRDCTNVACDSAQRRCWIGRDCPDGTVCVSPSCGAEGVCVERQPNCPTAGAPVCDCLGITRGSHCEAQSIYRSVAHDGACRTQTTCTYQGVERTEGIWDAGDGCNYCSCADGEVICTDKRCTPCGSGLAPCAADEYCYFTGTSCGTEGAGHCELKPRGNCQLEAPSVCGCDGERYTNYCYAAAAGTSVGECALDE